jgi:membrane fusion protein (multidrug efflux system)
MTDAIQGPGAGAGSPHGQGTSPPGEHPRLGLVVLLFGIGLVAVAVVAVIGTALGKRHALRQEGKSRTEQLDRGPVVRVGRAEPSPATRDVHLTADVRGFYQTTLYAKISGYVRDVRVDKGDRVSSGQILGSVESPETDEAVASAEYTEILRRKVHRRTNLLAPDVLAEQDLDTANADLGVSNANVKGAVALKRYEVLRAPFNGVVTARYVDPGALLPAATGGTESALPFVDVERTDVLRIFVYVSQDVAVFVHEGDSAVVWQNEHPSLRVPATVARTSGGLDPRTRTMIVEVDLDNAGIGLLPGTFANVDLKVAATPLPTVPVEALVVRGGKNMLARIEANRVHLVEIDVGLTNGKTLQVLRGIGPGDQVALDLPVDVSDGAQVQPQEKKPEAKGAGAKP